MCSDGEACALDLILVPNLSFNWPLLFDVLNLIFLLIGLRRAISSQAGVPDCGFSWREKKFNFKSGFKCISKESYYLFIYLW